MKKWLVPSLSAALLAACSSDQISKSDVQDALEHSAKNSVCVPFSLNVEHRAPNEDVAQSQLGMPEVRLLKRLNNGKRANPKAVEQMDILVNAGIYEEAKGERIGEGDHAIRYLVYRLTDKGRESFSLSPHGAWLCIGKQHVEKIHYFTEPTPANGITISQVSYQAEIQIERWARKLLRDNPYYAGLEQSLNKKITLVKTNEGWRDVRELRRGPY